MADITDNEKILLEQFPQLKDAFNNKFTSLIANYGYEGIPAILIRSFLDDHNIKYKMNYLNVTPAGIVAYEFIINEMSDTNIEKYYNYN